MSMAYRDVNYTDERQMTLNQGSLSSNHLLQFRSMNIFVPSPTHQFTKLYKWKPGYKHWWKHASDESSCSICSMAEWFPGKSTWCWNEQVCQSAVMLTTMHEVLRLSMLCTSYLFIFRHHVWIGNIRWTYMHILHYIVSHILYTLLHRE